MVSLMRAFQPHMTSFHQISFYPSCMVTCKGEKLLNMWKRHVDRVVIYNSKHDNNECVFDSTTVSSSHYSGSTWYYW
jgi:hypothetical protein